MGSITKREFLMVATGSAAAALLGMPAIALGKEAAAASAAEFLGGAVPAEEGITLELPEIAENGYTVPLSVRVDAPATDENHVESLIVLADSNPEPVVAIFHFSPLSGRQEATTRIRLARTQDITAIARMTDGSFLKTEVNVKVTIGGCGS